LLKILDDPLEGGTNILPYRLTFAFGGLLLYKIGIFPSFMDNQKILRHTLFHCYLKFSEKAKMEKIIPVNTAKEISEITSKDIENKLLEVQNFLKIFIVFDKYLRPEENKEIALTYVLSQLYHFSKQQCDRIAEFLKNKNYGLMSLSDKNKNLFLIFVMSELIYFLQNGLLDVSFSGHPKEVVFYPSKRSQGRLRLFWLNELINFYSDVADRQIMMNTCKQIENFDRAKQELTDVLVDYILDKTFSIKTNMFRQAIRQSSQFRLLREVVMISVYAESFNSIDIERLIKKSRINEQTIYFLKDVLDKDAGEDLASLSNFIRIDNFKIYRGGLNFRYGLRKFAGRALDMFEEDNLLKNIRGTLGESFEKSYILNELKSFEFLGYTSHGEFKPSTNSVITGYDIDLILRDEYLNLYYLLQVKYWFSSTPTYLSERVKFFNGDQVQKGVGKQLKILKDNLDEPSIREKLKNRGLSGVTKQNSYFILLHNIPFLNFYEDDGILFYEWNLLRNILQKGRMTLVDGKEIKETSSKVRLPLNSPEKIADAYFELMDSQKNIEFKKQWELYQRAWISFKIGYLNIRTKLI